MYMKSPIARFEFLLLFLLIGSRIEGAGRIPLEDNANVQVIGGVRQDRLGTNMDGLGDFNGDGIDDFAVSTFQFEENWRANYVYVVFGSDELSAIIDLLTPPQNTFVINGGNRILRCCGVGDFNGDGINDLVVTNPSKDIDGLAWAGEALIVAGTCTSSGEILYSDIDPLARVEGHVSNQTLGNILARAGDFNGDGLADIAMQSFYDYSNSKRTVTIVYGSTDVPNVLSTGDLGDHGTVIHHAFKYDGFASTMTCAGDVNGDGFDDLLIGADADDQLPDRAYLIYGGTDLPPVIEVSSLGKYGVVLDGDSFQSFTQDVAGVGDMNRDGYDDILVSKLGASPGGVKYAGETYLVFGGPNLPNTIRVAALGNLGITIRGTETEQFLGKILSGPGNWNGDLYPDFALAPNLDFHDVYLVLGGSAFGSPKTMRVDQLNAVVVHDDEPILTSFPRDISFIGDINGDGLDDLAVADWFYGILGRDGTGTVYIFYGGQFFPTATPTETPTITPTPEETPTPTITATPTPSFTPRDPEFFSGWILKGNGEISVTPEAEE